MLKSTAWVLAVGLLTSCVSVSWTRTIQLDPLDPGQLDALEIGGADLADCLAALGAPVRVMETAEGAALAWYWLDRTGLTGSFAVPMGEALSVDFRYGEVSRDTQGALLFFDEAWRLTALRQGQIAELLSSERRRPGLAD